MMHGFEKKIALNQEMVFLETMHFLFFTETSFFRITIIVSVQEYISLVVSALCGAPPPRLPVTKERGGEITSGARLAERSCSGQSPPSRCDMTLFCSALPAASMWCRHDLGLAAHAHARYAEPRAHCSCVLQAGSVTALRPTPRADSVRCERSQSGGKDIFAKALVFAGSQHLVACARERGQQT